MPARASAPLVSVIMPTYNRARWIGTAIASLLAQDVGDWELLVVDDGSTDDSRRAVPDDGRIRYLARAHTGNVAAVRNAGLAEAIGRWVGFLDSDDRWRADKLARQLRRLAEVPEAAWCYGPHGLIDEHGREIAKRESARRPLEGDGLLLSRLLASGSVPALQTVLVRRDVAVRLGFDPDIPFGDDLDFVLRLAASAPAVGLGEALADVREHAGRGNRARYDQYLHLARAYRKCAAAVADAELRRLCRRQAWVLTRDYLAHARRAGALIPALRRAVGLWLSGRPETR